MRYVSHPSLNGNGGAFNPAFAGLRGLLNGSTAPQAKPAPIPEPPAQPELPFQPALPPAPPKQRLSRKRGQQIRSLMWTTGRSQAHCQQLMKVIEAGDPQIISLILMHRISVAAAKLL